MSSSLTPHRRSVLFWPWALAVNGIAASPYIGWKARSRILRACGLDVRSDFVAPRVYFHTANISLAEGAWLNHGVHIENVARVEIGPLSGLGVHTVVITSNHEIGPSEERLGAWRREPVTVGAGCWVGARCLILPGVTIGDGCIVAAGSTVRDDCEPNGVYAGVPARRVRDL